MKFRILLILPLLIFLLSTTSVMARSGCCSHHGGVCGCGCCDGTSLSNTCAPYYPECNQPVYVAPVTPSFTPVVTPTPTIQPTQSPIATVSPTPIVTQTPEVKGTATFIPNPTPTSKSEIKPLTAGETIFTGSYLVAAIFIAFFILRWISKHSKTIN